MSEPREFDFAPLNVLHSIWWESPKQRWGSENSNMLTRSVFVDSDFAGDPVSRKSTTGLVAQFGNHILWNLDQRFKACQALSVGQAEFCAVVKRGQVGLSPEIYVPRSGNSSEDWNTKWQFDGEFFDGPIGSRTVNEAHWHAVLLDTKNESKMETSVSRRCLQRRTAQMLERSQSLLQDYNNIANCKIGILLTVDPTIHYKMKADEVYDGSGDRVADPTWTRSHEHRNRQLSALIVNIETDVQAEWNQLMVDKSLSTSHDERIMTAIARSKARAKCKTMAKCNAKFCELTDAKLGDNFQSPQMRDDDRESRRIFRTKVVFVHWFVWVLWILPRFSSRVLQKVQTTWEECESPHLLAMTVYILTQPHSLDHLLSVIHWRTLRMNGSRKRFTAHCDT